MFLAEIDGKAIPKIPSNLDAKNETPFYKFIIPDNVVASPN